MSTCGPVPRPQTFPYGPLAADSPALTVPSLLALLVYGSSGTRVAEKEREGLARHHHELMTSP